jgi:hypothetical protein
MAASRVQNVRGGQTIDILMRQAFNPAWAVSAPTLAITGISEGQTLSGGVPFSISVSAANAVKYIDVRFGHRHILPSLVFSDRSSVDVSWNTVGMPNGDSYLNVITYDVNHNSAEITIPVRISNTPNPNIPPPAMPAWVRVDAFTFAEQFGMFMQRRTEALRRLEAKGMRGLEPGTLQTSTGVVISPQAAPPDSTLFVRVSWMSVPGATSHKIYRSFSIDGPWTHIATRTPTIFIDASPDLAPGRAVYYRVRAVNTAGEGPKSHASGTIPLGRFDVALSAPANNATDQNVATFPFPQPPLFTWTPSGDLGDTQLYRGYVVEVNAFPVWTWIITNTTRILYGDPAGWRLGELAPRNLKRLTQYEWDIWHAEASKEYAGIMGRAFSFPAFGPFGNSSSNGAFRFTTR